MLKQPTNGKSHKMDQNDSKWRFIAGTPISWMILKFLKGSTIFSKPIFCLSRGWSAPNDGRMRKIPQRSLVDACHVPKLHTGLWGDHDLGTALVAESWRRKFHELFSRPLLVGKRHPLFRIHVMDECGWMQIIENMVQGPSNLGLISQMQHPFWATWLQPSESPRTHHFCCQQWHPTGHQIWCRGPGAPMIQPAVEAGHQQRW